MRDYEHMIMAIDELICHNVAGIICMENYKNCYFPNGFRKVFDSFCEIREEYESNRPNYLDEGLEDIGKAGFQALCRERKEELLRQFILELKAINSDIDYEAEVRKYYCTLDKEDVQTSEMYLTVYPFLISIIREKEEGNGL